MVSVDSSTAGVSATEAVGKLRREEPRVFVGTGSLSEGKFTVNPMCLTDEEASYAIGRIEAQFDV